MAGKLYLYTKWSERHPNPPVERARQVLEQVFHSVAKISDEAFQEHPNAWLEYFAPDGKQYVLDVYRTKRIYLAITDPNDDDAEQLFRMDDVSQERAMQLWMWFYGGEVKKVRDQPWAETRSDGGDELQSAGWA
jgi:hypothetical protein